MENQSLTPKLLPRVHVIPNLFGSIYEPSFVDTTSKKPTKEFLTFREVIDEIAETKTVPFEFNRNTLINFLQMDYWRDLTGSKSALNQASWESSEIELDIIREFGSIDKVLRIYTSTIGREIKFSILINSRTYDEVLMDLLLDKEIKIMHMYPGQAFSFKYIPVNEKITTSNVISREAKQIL